MLEKYFHLSLNPIDMDIFLDMHEILLFSLYFIFFKLFAIYLVKYFLQTSYAPLSWAQDINSSVIRQKGESQNGCFKQTKHAKKCSFFGKFSYFVFLKHLFWDSVFCLITDELNVHQTFRRHPWHLHVFCTLNLFLVSKGTLMYET